VDPVILLYLRFLRRAEARGIGRHSADTPHEFAGTTSKQFPDVEQDVRLLSDAFVEARYSTHVPNPDNLPKTLAAWQRIREALRTSPEEPN
jgi:hypothetical protein